jgi:NDP-sugar pyrophosphorylase family protein
MKGFLLAAGLGTRLWPLSDQRAKPAFPFFGTPLIRHTAELLARAGVRKFWANTHYLPETVREALQGFSQPVELVHEPEILGTGGALVNLRDALAGDTVVVVNAKIVTDIDIAAAVAAHERAGATVTMVCVPNAKRERFTHVDAVGGVLSGFVGADALIAVPEPRLFTGIQILSPAFFAELPAPGFSDTIKDIYPLVQKRGGTIQVYDSAGAWSEFSTVRRYRDLHGEGFIDARAEVALSARVTRSVVWAGARIGAGAMIEGCVVGADAVVPEGHVARDTVLVPVAAVRETRDARVKGALLEARIV